MSNKQTNKQTKNVLNLLSNVEATLEQHCNLEGVTSTSL